ncbi:hypothetical protein AB0M58_34925 [Streptomyces bobili]|uniref:hypothetical protein n=1 Tax=Streptomyces bobili TaxID=67280 RepID=UPI003448C1C4
MDRIDRRTPTGFGSEPPPAAGPDGEGEADEPPLDEGEGEGEAEAEAEADGEALPFVAEAEGDPLTVGEAKEMSPDEVSLSDVVRSSPAADFTSKGLSAREMVATHATTVATARTPASQSRRVPGARVVSGAQPFSQGRSWEGRDLLSGMRCSSSGARMGDHGCDGRVCER